MLACAVVVVVVLGPIPLDSSPSSVLSLHRAPETSAFLNGNLVLHMLKNVQSCKISSTYTLTFPFEAQVWKFFFQSLSGREVQRCIFNSWVVIKVQFPAMMCRYLTKITSLLFADDP
jgi:hypothetical protein